jgi:hypothetical protein
MDATGGNTTIQQGQTIINIANLNNANFGGNTSNQPFNELMTRDLLAAIRPYSKPATKFMELVKDKPDWNQRASISDQAKDILAYSFVGVLGIQIRKLMAIGKEQPSEAKLRSYIDNSIVTAKRTIQILCFALLSDMWKIKKEKEHSLSASQEDVIKHFFEDWLELSIKDLFVLLHNLYDFYRDHNLPFPIPELTELSGSFAADSDLSKTALLLDQISETPDSDKYSAKNCTEVEMQLTHLLSAFSFLAAYKMVSIKSINYEEMPNNAPRYLHNYISLGFDSKINANTERYNYLDTPITTDSILLFKGNYMNGIVLFPFIIDLNALVLEGGVKICFYSSMDMDENCINYCFLEDNRTEKINFSDVLKGGVEINEVLEDREKRKKLKLDNVFLQFKEAKKTILGTFEFNLSLEDGDQ